ncbi:MAG TPA: multidrug efflux protein [Gammaproteobacteria bacterium]|nr:multidrug efflux protein [Gammaproteobacteria bacterium]
MTGTEPLATQSTQARWTDLFIRKPVLAIALSAVIAILGGYGLSSLTVREYPRLVSTTISVNTAYPGASPQTIQSYITEPLSRVLGSVPGLNYLTSSSSQGQSSITLNMRLNTNPDAALAQTLTKIKRIEPQLPRDSFPPGVSASSGHSTALMYIAFYSPDDSMRTPQIVDYVVRNVQPRVQTVAGVAEAQIVPPSASGGNGNNQAVRVWLDPSKMAARQVTAADVRNALSAQNIVAAIGKTKGPMISIPLTSNLELNKPEQFKKLVITSVGDTPIYLEDIARVEMGAENYASRFYFDGHVSVAIGIQTTPSANALDTALGVSKQVEALRNQLPPGLAVGLPYNAATFIDESIREVVTTIGITLAVVMLVIYLFLGSFRGLLIPGIAIPLSLAGAGFLMFLSGYSYNLITLLAFVLAIGLVVDDAIVVVENVHRHIDAGRSGFQAAVLSARELTMPVIVMSTTLVAVFLPVIFTGGLTGILFTEFALTIIFAVLVSMLVALTLSPVMSGHFLRRTPERGLAHFLDRVYSRLNRSFDRSLHGFLEFPSVGLVFVIATLIAVYFMFTSVRHELSPPQNGDIIFTVNNVQPDASPGYIELYARQVLDVLHTLPEKEHSFMVTGFSPAGAGSNGFFAGVTLKSKKSHRRTAEQIKPGLQAALNKVAGVQGSAFTPPPLPGSSGLFPIDFVITSDGPFDELEQVAEQVLASARQSGKFLFIEKNLKIDQPQYEIRVDRKLAANLGISMRDIAVNLQTMLSGAYVNRFTSKGYTYQVVPQVVMSHRATRQALEQIYLRSASGQMVPLSTLVSFAIKVIPQALPQFNRLNSVSLQGVQFPGVSEGDALTFLKTATGKTSSAVNIDYSGASRQFIEQGDTFMVSVILAIVLIYLLLAAQFNSFRDSLIILFTVPMAAVGALLLMTPGLASLNIYTQIALITLVGLITKQGILVVQFAKDLQYDEGLGIREAVEKAASIRLRPVLMTTLSMVLGVVPLIIATGSGAPPRNQLGIVIAAGLGIGAFFSLYIVPLMYLYLARDATSMRETEARQHRDLEALADGITGNDNHTDR